MPTPFSFSDTSCRYHSNSTGDWASFSHFILKQKLPVTENHRFPSVGEREIMINGMDDVGFLFNIYSNVKAKLD